MGKAIAGTVWEMSLGKFDAAKAKLLNQLGERGAEVIARLNEEPDYCYRVAKAMVAGLAGLSVDELLYTRFFATMQILCQDSLTKFAGAVTILGNDFISPIDIALDMKVTYSTEQLAMFAQTMPIDEVLKWMAANEYMLVAGPPSETSLRDIRKRKPELFSDGTTNYTTHNFYHADKIDTEWLALRKTAVPNSDYKVWHEQTVLLREEEMVPNVAAATWGIIAYKVVRNQFPCMSVRTDSVYMCGEHADVHCCPHAAKLQICSDLGGREYGLGLAAALKM